MAAHPVPLPEALGQEIGAGINQFRIGVEQQWFERSLGVVFFCRFQLREASG